MCCRELAPHFRQDNAESLDALLSASTKAEKELGRLQRKLILMKFSQWVHQKKWSEKKKIIQGMVGMEELLQIALDPSSVPGVQLLHFLKEQVAEWTEKANDLASRILDLEERLDLDFESQLLISDWKSVVVLRALQKDPPDIDSRTDPEDKALLKEQQGWNYKEESPKQRRHSI